MHSGGFVPTRLVDVGSPNSPEVRLRHTVGLDLKDPRYLALSHCWGLTIPPSATTTSATLPERLRSIPLANLTRTFLDCITIARKLDIQYIWIDSLCILQDSRSDWEQEAAQMASVYSNAYCTISASGSSDGNGGCHVDENSRAYGPVTLSWDNMDQKIRTFSLFGESILNVLINDPLTQRAWTLQERELSPRVLHYSHDAVRWECRSLKASSTFPWEDSSAFNGALRAFDVGQIAGVTAHQLDLEQREKNETAWFDTVFKYSGRALTKHSDRLPAISGIARAVQIVTDDTYLAGLWRSNLLHCLLWTSAWYDSKGLISHTRPESFLAPSWSWASVAGQVKYETWIFDALHPAPDTRLLPTILEASTTPVGFDAFGQCKGGAIRLKGRLKPAMTLGEGFARQDREGLYNLAADVDTPVKVGDIRWDVPSEAPAGRIQGLICLCAAIRKEKYGDTVGLAIVPVAGEGSPEFRRVGLVYMLLVSWWEKSVELEVTIV